MLAKTAMPTKPTAKPVATSLAKARAELQTRIKYQFQNPALFTQALTHPSGALPDLPHNQRLEFLGDRVLGLIVTDALYEADSEASEGGLARALAECVDNACLASIARNIALGDSLAVQPNTNLANEDKVLADALEALVAAVWRDGGMVAAKKLVHHLWGVRLQAASATAKDSKTRLQEYTLASHGTLPKYSVLDQDGPDHALLFTAKVELKLADSQEISAIGKGKTRRLAEREAATNVLALIDNAKPQAKAKDKQP